MSRYVFLYKDKNSDDRDCVKYIKDDPARFECDHYFGGINLCGAFFSTGFNYEKSNYDNVITILTRKEFDRLIQFNEDIHNLGYGIKKGDDRYISGLALIEEIKPIFDKLNSDGNAMLFEKIAEEETEYLMAEYGLSEDDIQEIFSNYGLDYRDRGVISYIFNSIDDCAEEEAESLGYVTRDNERWFDYEKFGSDLLEEERYLELSDGRVAAMNY